MEFLIPQEGPFPRLGHLGRGPHGLPRAMLAFMLFQSLLTNPFFSCFHLDLLIVLLLLFLAFLEDSLTSLVQICSVSHFTIDCP